MNFDQLRQLYACVGCKRLYAKPLAENDNSKNQVYFAGTVDALNIFPSTEIFADNNSKGPTFKARLDFGWLSESGAIAKAPGAQLIVYSQYPEVRFSGFLAGCPAAPSELMNKRLQGRILFLGVTSDRKVIGYVSAGDSQITAQFNALSLAPSIGVFCEINLPGIPGEDGSRIQLLNELKRIHEAGWILSKQLDQTGQLLPCNAPQCGGFTLEAELGIAKNSMAEPDFLGWEIKQHAVSNFSSMQAGAITLMTPEPTGGFYKDGGVEAFIRRFGYPDLRGRPERLNFGGIHMAQKRQSRTGLTLKLLGYDAENNRITDATGMIALVTDDEELAAAWDFSKIFAHWARKHRNAAYVPSINRRSPELQYAYGNKIRLATGTDPLKLLAAICNDSVYYDPGIKLENASGRVMIKRRSQFRVASRNIQALYDEVELVEL